jgi:hypothetical protein
MRDVSHRWHEVAGMLAERTANPAPQRIPHRASGAIGLREGELGALGRFTSP